ncbi:MAG: hypothetical protein PUH10_00425 [Erysipelotrichaceae bacterium]|uniref:hypothetical protein n=1 Tax=Floccifex sp. TaxID=2815810 RepID=UPI002A75ECA8|nr:hypothetical protein [Floccifex sp.]MDD7280456.1 hypothetical protein [Erysipelotrichaceae bacterium]MDY2958826.1 hypothetical protein [Floccifex sp.]
MNKLKNKLYQFMAGRYGADSLNNALTYLALFLCVVQLFIKNPILSLFILVFLIYVNYRMFSKNIVARRIENDKYQRFIKPYQLKWKYRKTHKVFRCKQCQQIIRVPKGKGTIEVTCPKCKAKITKRT